MELRASGMPMAMLCPGAARVPEVQIRSSGAAADAGTAAHAALARLVVEGEMPWDDLSAIAGQYKADPDEVRILSAMGRKMWLALREAYPWPQVEVELHSVDVGGVSLTGHADVVAKAIGANEIRILDWKTGRKDSDYSEQMRAYSALALAAHPELERAVTTLGWVRDGEVETSSMTHAEALVWLDDVASRVVQWDGEYHTGDHCTWCKRWHECPAAQSRALACAKSIVATKADTLATMPPAELLDLFDRAKLVVRVAYELQTELARFVGSTGPITANGRTLEFASRTVRSLDPRRAWSVLEAAGFGDEEFAQVISMSISKVEELVVKRSERGKGAAAHRALADQLRAAGAVIDTERKELKIKRTA